jgi:hypothetical protein
MGSLDPKVYGPDESVLTTLTPLRAQPRLCDQPYAPGVLGYVQPESRPESNGVVACLERLSAERCAPAYVRFDNGPECVRTR